MEAEIRMYVFAAAAGDCEGLETPYELAVRLGVSEEKRDAFVERIFNLILETHQEMEDLDLLEEAGRRGLSG